MNSTVLIDAIGWIGVVSLLVGYALVSTKKLQGDSTVYQLLNLAGSGLLLINTFYHAAYPSVGINVAWVAIAIYALARRRLSAQREN